MANFLLIVCKDETNDSAFEQSLLKAFFAKLFRLLKPGSYSKKAETFQICEDIDAVLLKLQYKPNKLQKLGKRKQNKIIKYIEGIKSLHKCNSVYLSDKLKTVDWLQEFNSASSVGEKLYKSLALKIIDTVCKNSGISIRDLDITIVHGTEDLHLLELIRLLSDHVKFVTIVSDDKERIGDSLSNIYSETGLSVGITRDYKRGLKNADVIINLGSLKEFVVNSRVNTKAVIINLRRVEFIQSAQSK